jgi:excisionase family DNA binding protein
MSTKQSSSNPYLPALAASLADFVEQVVRAEVARQLADHAAQQPAPVNMDHTISEKELCARLGISPRTAARLRARKRIRFVQVGRRVRYTPEHIAEFIRSNERGKRK